ncbi:hypothetical protein TNCV_3411491 [Trichonephila clavipes]|nr:hypothetical protein TNCV_3411491 [Trichonephila clavipes]
MSLRRRRSNYEKHSKFEGGGIIRLQEDNFSFLDAAERLSCVFLLGSESSRSPFEHIWNIIGPLQHHPQTALTVPVLTQQVQQAWNSIPSSDIRHLLPAQENQCCTSYLLNENVSQHRLSVQRWAGIEKKRLPRAKDVRAGIRGG